MTSPESDIELKSTSDLNLNDINASIPGELYFRKYLALQKKCEIFQQNNEKLINRLHKVKKLIKRYKKDRKLLIAALNEKGDDYKDAPVPYMWEETEKYKSENLSFLNNDAQDSVSSHSSAHSIVGSPEFKSTGTGEREKPLNFNSTPKLKKIKTEKDRDIQVPKKPANAFFMFCQHQRAGIQEEYFKDTGEEISHQDLTKCMAQQWNNLSSEHKKRYYDLYEKEKEKYDEEVKILAGRDVKPIFTEQKSLLDNLTLLSSISDLDTVIKSEPTK